MSQEKVSVAHAMAVVLGGTLPLFETVVRTLGFTPGPLTLYECHEICYGLVQALAGYLVEPKEDFRDDGVVVTALLIDRAVLLGKHRPGAERRQDRQRPAEDYAIIGASFAHKAERRDWFERDMRYGSSYWDIGWGEESEFPYKPIPTEQIESLQAGAGRLPMVQDETIKGAINLISGKRRKYDPAYYRLAVNPTVLEKRETVAEEYPFNGIREYVIGQRIMNDKRALRHAELNLQIMTDIHKSLSKPF